MSSTDIDLAMESLDAEMIRHKIDSKAINMAKYLKNHFACYGIKSPVRNEIQRKWFTELKKYDLDPWDIVYNLWAKDQREYQYIAIDYMRRIPKKSIDKDDYRKLEELITTKSWWDSVDGLATNLVGRYFEKFPEMKEQVIEKWRHSDDMWLNRTCLIFQMKYKNDVDFKLLKDLIRQYQPVKEFFIQKAIGWSLRQYSKFNPKGVKDFVEEVNLQGLL